MTYDEIIKKVDEYLKTGNYDWANGRVSGSIYFFNQDLIKLTTEVYGKASYTNPLHPDVFPGVCKMEAEVVRMTANLFHGSSESCGTMTTGGTESIMMACKAYRDYGREENGITKPNIVMPVTAHSAFDKAAQYMGMFVKTIKVNPRTTQVDIKAMERAINSNTIMVSPNLTIIWPLLILLISLLDPLPISHTVQWMTSKQLLHWERNITFQFMLMLALVDLLLFS